MERHLDGLEGRVGTREKRILTKADFCQALIAAHALVVAMHVGVFCLCRAVIGAG